MIFGWVGHNMRLSTESVKTVATTVVVTTLSRDGSKSTRRLIVVSDDVKHLSEHKVGVNGERSRKSEIER